MVVSEPAASAFIQGYTQVMVEIYGQVEDSPEDELLEILATARAKFIAEPSLLDNALRVLESRSTIVDPKVVSAIRSLEVKDWIYLKDTSAYSIFIDPSSEAAYGVLGLTERIRNIIGGSGAIIQTGLLRYQDRYVIDGIITKVVWLGTNYRKSFGSLYTELRAKGAFYKVSSA